MISAMGYTAKENERGGSYRNGIIIPELLILYNHGEYLFYSSTQITANIVPSTSVVPNKDLVSE